MFKSSSRFSVYVFPIFIIIASLTLMGCPKKVSSVSGSAGVTNDRRSSADPSSPSRNSLSREDSSGETRQDEVASIRKGDSSREGRSPDFGDQSQRERRSPDFGGQSQDEVASIRKGDSSRESRPSDFGDQSQTERRGVPPLGSGMANEGPSFNENIYFDFDRSIVRKDAKGVLLENARWLALNSDVKVRIEGHGDERGTNDYNLALGERRARSIVRYLINLGIRESRFTFISFGEERGLCEEKTEECYQKNRRAHFLVRK